MGVPTEFALWEEGKIPQSPKQATRPQGSGSALLCGPTLCLCRAKSANLGEVDEDKTKSDGSFLKIFPLEICQTSCA